MGERRSIYTVLVGKSDEKRPLGKSKCRWQDNIQMDLGWGVWSGLIWLWIETGGGMLLMR